jgi:hypothetical protein
MGNTLDLRGEFDAFSTARLTTFRWETAMNKTGFGPMRYCYSGPQEYVAIPYMSGHGYFGCSLEGVCHGTDQ